MTDKINSRNFENLLNWLSEDLDQSAREYEKFHRTLVVIFINRGCVDAENLADETIDRVARKIDEIKTDYTGEKLHFFLGVARQVAREYHRSKEARTNIEEIDENKITARVELEENFNENTEIEIKCLRKCLGNLSAEKRALVLAYYNTPKGKKKEYHRNLQKKYSLSSNNLKNQAHRLKKKLFECVRECRSRKK